MKLRRVHVARVEREEAHALSAQFLVPDAAQLMQRGLARAVRAPAGIRVDRGIARYVEDHRAAAFARGRGQRADP